MELSQVKVGDKIKVQLKPQKPSAQELVVRRVYKNGLGVYRDEVIAEYIDFDSYELLDVLEAE